MFQRRPHRIRCNHPFPSSAFGPWILLLTLWPALLTPLSTSAYGNAGSIPGRVLVQEIAQPEQPADGPGGTAYSFDNVQVERIGGRPQGATAFMPGGIDRPMLDDLPVIVFLHGFTAVEPQRYGGWIEHLVKRGAIVIYPDYQDAGVFAGGQDRYIDNMFTGIAAALVDLDLRPETVHVVGHSLGAVLTMVYGTAALENGLPPAASLTLIEPGGCANCGNGIGFGVPVQLDLQVPGDSLVSIVVGADDALVGTSDAEVLSGMANTIPRDRRRFVIARSDAHGAVPLVADHLFPQTAGNGGEEDALDWYGLWRPLDALILCADSGQECETALGTSAAALSMGRWSDGVPVAPPRVQNRTEPGGSPQASTGRSMYPD